MKKYVLNTGLMLFVFAVVLILTTCSKPNDEQKPTNGTWDIDKDGIPKFVAINYIELFKIKQISKFRSSVGHDYSDAFEHCRSMKHYFVPKDTVEWAQIIIKSPVTGIITRVEVEWAGTKLEIASDAYPAFRFSIFHINTLHLFNLDDKVTAGEQLGTHIGSQTYSDISVIVNDPTKQGRMVSYFDVLTDDAFNEYVSRGVSNRNILIISKTIRDENPLTCNGDSFDSTDTLENWINLN